MNITLTEKQLINYFVDGQEDVCVEIYLQDGPKGLREYLSIPQDRNDIWESVYDYFLFEKYLLQKACERFSDFLVDVMTVYGPGHLRTMFCLEGAKYDGIFNEMIQMIGVAEKGLIRFMRRNPAKFLAIFQEQGSDAVRKKLHIEGYEFDGVWKQILDVLLESYSGEKVHDRRKEHVKEFFRKMRLGFMKNQAL